MLIILKIGTTNKQILRIIQGIEYLGFKARISKGSQRTAVLVHGNIGYLDESYFNKFEGIRKIIHISERLKMVYRENNPSDTVVNLGDGIKFGGKESHIIAGPCSVEDKDMIMETAGFLSSRGVKILRGGAFKPRTSPYSFQGLQEKGLVYLADAAAKHNMKIVSEAMDEYSLKLMAETADIIQIGARNMQNYSLLKKCGQLDKPILLKRGFNATLDDLLVSLEYILSEGNTNVIVCERGIRMYGASKQRSILDLIGLSDFKNISHLPIIVDPSHCTRDRSKVPNLAKAAMIYGCDGLMVEVHPNPDQALSDGPQSLTFNQFDKLLIDLKKLSKMSEKPLRIFD
ncbi:MAG: 3-deoxy-7-phosphoheptulonate synthase [Candidatus Delongbacteria bacterium]|jgi:3-deoxy-7-phosphoheptulonate synthase|nr:3-deoxy-7-phosphoheptulonate synthase [Candidatus Delongbacteria bacterium]